MKFEQLVVEQLLTRGKTTFKQLKNSEIEHELDEHYDDIEEPTEQSTQKKTS